MTAFIRWWALVVTFPIALGLVVSVHLRHRGEASLGRSDKALAEGDSAMAVAWARDAAMSLAPGSPYPSMALARLTIIANQAEERGDFDLAVQALRAERSAIAATRTEQDEATRLSESRRALVRIAAKACEGNQTRAPAACAAVTESTLADSSATAAPRSGWLALGAAAFLVGGTVATRSGAGPRLVPTVVSVLGAALAGLTLLLR